MMGCSENSVIDSLCDGPVKIVVEILFLIHLVTAFPILMNPPNQFFEGLLRIKTSMYYSFTILKPLLLRFRAPSCFVPEWCCAGVAPAVLNTPQLRCHSRPNRRNDHHLAQLHISAFLLPQTCRQKFGEKVDLTV